MLTSPQTKTYRRWRHAGLSAVLAYRWATEPTPTSEREFDWNDHGTTTTRGGYQIRVTIEPDDCGDHSHYGHFTDTWQEGAIHWSNDSRSYKYFVPTNSIAETAAYNSSRGMSKSVALDVATRQARQDAHQAAEYAPMIVSVTASQHGVVLGSDILGGCDYSDIDGWERCLADHAMIETAVHEADLTVSRLIASADQNLTSPTPRRTEI